MCNVAKTLSKYKIVMLYLISILVYGKIVSVFTCTVHTFVDEELYLALAKSFHYQGSFLVDGVPVSYTCVLYSLLISLAYYFYTPDKILFVMRFMNVCVMCSAVFPIWFMAKKALCKEKSVFLLSAFSMLLPFMFNTAYIMQETLSYPLFLWTLYFMTASYDAKEKRKNIYIMAGACFSVLCFFTKTYLFFIPVIVNLCYLLDKQKKEKLKAIICYDLSYVVFAGVMYLYVLYVNGFVTGGNHYSTQFSNLFPIGAKTIICGISCCVITLSLFIVNTGILPFGVLLQGRKKLGQGLRWLCDFCILASVFLVVEIIFLVVLTEEGVTLIPHKFLFRYFQILFPPIFLLFFKCVDEMPDVLKSKQAWIIGAGSLLVTGAYFVLLDGGSRQAIMDGYSFLLIQSLKGYITPNIDIIFIGGLIVLLVALWILQIKKPLPVKRTLFGLYAVYIIGFWLLNCVQLPDYTNRDSDGIKIEADSIPIAEYLNQKEVDAVYFLPDEGWFFARTFCGYIRQPFQTIAREQLAQLDKSRSFAIVTSVKDIPELEAFNKVELGNQNLFLYENQ